MNTTIATHPLRAAHEPPHAQAPLGLNHLVLNVADIELSHRFYTELLGFQQTGTSSRPRADGLPAMRFYSGRREDRLTHHDFALYQVSRPARLDDPAAQRLDHVAFAYPSEASWRAQVRFLQARAVPLREIVERGATWSAHLEDPDGLEIELVFERPRSEWESDIEAALNTRTRHEQLP